MFIMKKFLKYAVSTMTIMLTSPALCAGVVADTKVIQVRIDSDGRGMVFFDKVVGGSPPACVVPSYSNALAFPATVAGRSILAVALVTKANQGTITVYGSGTCSIFGGYVENWDYGVAQ